MIRFIGNIGLKDSDEDLNRQRIVYTTNLVTAVLASMTLLYIGVCFLLDYPVKAFSAFNLLGFFLLILLVNWLRFHQAASIIASTGAVWVILAISLYTKIDPAVIHIMEYIEYPMYISATIVVPFYAFDYQEEKKWVWFSIIQTSLLLALYYPIHKWTGLSPDEKEIIHPINLFYFLAPLNYLVFAGLALFILTKRTIFQKEHLEAQTFKLDHQNTLLKKNQKQLETQKNKLDQESQHLMALNYKFSESLAAASSIQGAIMPREKLFKTIFRNYFLINRPRDTVSGDFYWFFKRDKFNFVSIGDCTGHGIPGALMTVIGCTLLTRIIKEQGLTKPGEILTALNRSIIDVLNQQDSGNESAEGMDVILFQFEDKREETIELNYAAAKLEGLVFDPEVGQLEILEKTRKSIGGAYHRDTIFESYSKTISSRARLVVSSDGYIDQNNKVGKKFGKLPFRRLVEQTSAKPLRLQKIELENALQSHMTLAPQRDDILVAGFTFIRPDPDPRFASHLESVREAAIAEKEGSLN